MASSELHFLRLNSMRLLRNRFHTVTSSGFHTRFRRDLYESLNSYAKTTKISFLLPIYRKKTCTRKSFFNEARLDGALSYDALRFTNSRSEFTSYCAVRTTLHASEYECLINTQKHFKNIKRSGRFRKSVVSNRLHRERLSRFQYPR